MRTSYTFTDDYAAYMRTSYIFSDVYAACMRTSYTFTDDYTHSSFVSALTPPDAYHQSSIYLPLFCYLQLFHTRYALHKRAYQHRVCAAVELMILEVLLLADPHLRLPGAGGALRRMSECPQDMHAYWRLSDYIIKQIEHSHQQVSVEWSYRRLSG